ncbi:protein O-linked-mannose beta-1,2-N-acetylglucosaminyltransferase 1-like [Palaemon carinicauda]|uniref:protein O-linked-mannose beta-1,2-N-acetylglucosaminyltransferase 1-like n=1 Tax=Palaemon carinicauda TaxID=392227 RepID=UPI0035B68643
MLLKRQILLKVSIVLVYTSKWTRATIHKINAELRDTPAVPAPSLRSQLRQAGIDHRGSVVMSTDTELCPNTLANINPIFDEIELNKTIKLVFNGTPPRDHISVITYVGQILANAFIQGVPVALSSKEIKAATIGVISAVVVHQSSGQVLRHYRHQAFKPSELLRAFVQSLQPGRILMIAGAARYLDGDLKKYLTELGVDIPTRENKLPEIMITWIGIVGGNTIGSTSRFPLPDRQPGLFQEFYIPRSNDVRWCGSDRVPRWSKEGEWKATVELCQKYDGYGRLCSCPPAPPPPVPRINKVNSLASEAAVVVLASRPTALHRLLESLEKVGTNKSNILVFTNDVVPELDLVCRSHGVFFEETGRASDCSALHKTRLYESALRASHILRPKAQFFLVLEDDMVVERDLFRWLTKARQILLNDDRFICINTISLHNEIGKKKWTNDGISRSNFDNSSAETRNSYRGQKFMPGWAVSRRILEAMLRFWPLALRDLQWISMLDYWAGDTPCIAPPRSYIKHVAAGIFTLGADLSPAIPQEASRAEHLLLRPFAVMPK